MTINKIRRIASLGAVLAIGALAFTTVASPAANASYRTDPTSLAKCIAPSGTVGKTDVGQTIRIPMSPLPTSSAKLQASNLHAGMDHAWLYQVDTLWTYTSNGWVKSGSNTALAYVNENGYPTRYGSWVVQDSTDDGLDAISQIVFPLASVRHGYHAVTESLWKSQAGWNNGHAYRYYNYTLPMSHSTESGGNIFDQLNNGNTTWTDNYCIS